MIWIPKGTRFLYRNTFSNYSAYLFSVDEINIEFVPGDNIDKNISKVLVLADELKTERANKIAQYLD